MNRRNWLKCLSTLIPAWLVRPDRQDGYFYTVRPEQKGPESKYWAEKVIAVS